MSARRIFSPLVVVHLLCLSACLVAPAGEEAPNKPVDAVRNPFASPEDLREGGYLVESYCAFCHGRDGRGGRGPNLVRGILRFGESNEALFKNIKNGIPATQMVAIPDIDDKTVWQVVGYIESRRRPEPLPVGCAENGQRLFAKHCCGTCHWDGREGGRRGPDLSRSCVPVDYIRESLLDPDANLRDEPNFEHEPYQQIVTITAKGHAFTGRWRNENAHYVLIIDQDEKLRAFARDEILEVVKPRRSLMPSFKDLLSDQDVNDLIRYLLSIRPKSISQESK